LGVNKWYDRVVSFSPEATWVLLGQLGVAISGLLGVKLLTNVLNVSEFGKLALANTVIGFVNINLFVPVGQGVMRFWAISNARGENNAFYSLSRRLIKKMCTMLFCLTLILFLGLTAAQNIKWALLISLSILVGIASGYSSIQVAILSAKRKRRQTALLEIGGTLLKPVLGVFFVWIMTASANVALIGFVSAAAIMLVITELTYSTAVPEMRGHGHESIHTLGKKINAYSLQFFFWQVFISIFLSCDKWAIQAYQGPESVGAYVVVAQLATYPLLFGVSFLHGFFLPIVYEKVGNFENCSRNASGFRALVVMAAVYMAGAGTLFLIFTHFHRGLILMISSERYARFSYLLPALTGGWALFYFGQLVSGFGMVANKLKAFSWIKVLSSIIALGSTLYLVQRWGVVGLVWAILISGGVYALCSSFVAYRIMSCSAIPQRVRKAGDTSGSRG
jgi:O-antigen/teichoic acid export membrane protein